MAAYAKELEAQLAMATRSCFPLHVGSRRQKRRAKKTIQYVRAQDDKNALALLGPRIYGCMHNLNVSLNSIISYAEENAGGILYKRHDRPCHLKGIAILLEWQW